MDCGSPIPTKVVAVPGIRIEGEYAILRGTHQTSRNDAHRIKEEGFWPHTGGAWGVGVYGALPESYAYENYYHNWDEWELEIEAKVPLKEILWVTTPEEYKQAREYTRPNDWRSGQVCDKAAAVVVLDLERFGADMIGQWRAPASTVRVLDIRENNNY